MIYPNFKLKELRTSAKITQVKMAEKVGVNTRQYQKYEQGTVDIPSSKLIFLADFFAVSLDYLVGRSDEP